MSASIQLGRALLLARQKKGYTQEETAERCQTSLRHYQDIEAGRVNPRLELFLRMYEVLELRLDDLIPQNKNE